MSDDKEWSLKDKKLFIPDSRPHDREYFDRNCYYYNKKDINTLREKLIEDIENEFRHMDIKLPAIKYTDGGDRLKSIINKRFGCDEDD